MLYQKYTRFMDDYLSTKLVICLRPEIVVSILRRTAGQSTRDNGETRKWCFHCCRR